jgi:hypothetical protein
MREALGMPAAAGDACWSIRLPAGDIVALQIDAVKG